jgi:hypothetical protein
MNMKFCEQCKCYHPPCAHDSMSAGDIANEHIKYLSDQIVKGEQDIKVLHRNCDPVDMTNEDLLVWERWDKVFNPENYD